MVRRYRRSNLRRRRGGIRRRRNYRVSRIPLVRRYKETYTKPLNIVLSSTAVGGRISTSLGELGNATSFNAMYDLFKITGMKVKLIPKLNQSSAYVGSGGTVVSNGIPTLYIAPNRNPLTPAPTSAADVLNDDQARAIRFDKPITLYLRSPKPDQQLYSADDGSIVGRVVGQMNVGSKYQPWFPTTGNGSLQNQFSAMYWYGFRWWVDNGASLLPFQFETIVTQYCMFKEQD